MAFNTEKCKVMHLGKENKKFDYYMNNQKLGVVNEEKDLGVFIRPTDDLKPSSQCRQVYAKAASRVLGTISRTISYTCKTPTVLLKLYKTLVMPHLEYCIPVCSPYYSRDKVLLERVQHRFTRMLPGLKQNSYFERLEHLGLWTLEERRNRTDLLEVFRMYRGLSVTLFDQFFATSLTQEVIQRRSRRPDATLMGDAFPSRRGSSTDGIGCNRKISTFYRPYLRL